MVLRQWENLQKHYEFYARKILNNESSVFRYLRTLVLITYIYYYINKFKIIFNFKNTISYEVNLSSMHLFCNLNCTQIFK